MPSVKKLSFSITTLLLVTALVASILSIYMLRKEKEALRISNRNMASELLAQFEITDPSQIHWSEVELPSKMTWRFRVYVPPGEQMQFNYAIAPSTEEFPKPMRSFEEIVEGSDQLQTITVQIYKLDAKSVKIDAFKNGVFTHGCISSDVNQFSWLGQLEEFSALEKQDHEGWPKLAKPSGRVLLLRKSESDIKRMMFGGLRKIANPPNQFMIWLEPVK